MQGIKIEFTDETCPTYWKKFRKYLTKTSNDNYSTYVSNLYHELRQYGCILNPLYAYRSGVDTLHFNNLENYSKFVEFWNNYTENTLVKR